MNSRFKSALFLRTKSALYFTDVPRKIQRQSQEFQRW